ncbi:Fur family transcriptional regulator [Floccifex sp.]|uniref:Fur family transcriptional regulator n=1 Tax=Floccifex sp. TaxID=2815810 RepID=UPI003EFCD1EF
MNRNTIQRDVIASCLKNNPGHLTADQIYQLIHSQHPAISKGTVYRNLNVLTQTNQIQRIENTDGPDFFEWNTHPHYHIKCIQCKRVFDVKMGYMNNIFDLVQDNAGFQFISHQIMFEGICPECLSKGD